MKGKHDILPVLLTLLLLVAAYLFVVFDSIYWHSRFQKEM